MCSKAGMQQSNTNKHISEEKAGMQQCNRNNNIFQKKRQLCSDCFNAENRQEFAAYNYETRPPGTTMTNCRVVFIEEMSHFHQNK